MTKQKKSYAVFVGHNPGVYDDYWDVQDQTLDFHFNQFKSFKSREEAQRAYDEYDKEEQAMLMRKSRDRALKDKAYKLWAAMHEEITGEVVLVSKY
ncbi:TPA: RNase H1/viroplasmin domain-containing protein [Vibrio parahaemolyticus]|nr:RNase H1/viroplasmin domain-containing protein [Vibrio parahaemolyticus]